MAARHRAQELWVVMARIAFGRRGIIGRPSPAASRSRNLVPAPCPLDLLICLGSESPKDGREVRRSVQCTRKARFGGQKKVLLVGRVAVTVGVLYWVFHSPLRRADMWPGAEERAVKP